MRETADMGEFIAARRQGPDPANRRVAPVGQIMRLKRLVNGRLHKRGQPFNVGVRVFGFLHEEIQE